MNIDMTTAPEPVKRVAKNKYLVLAGILTAGETLVNMGINLPGVDLIPPQYRSIIILGVLIASFIFRTICQREEEEFRATHTQEDYP